MPIPDIVNECYEQFILCVEKHIKEKNQIDNFKICVKNCLENCFREKLPEFDIQKPVEIPFNKETDIKNSNKRNIDGLMNKGKKNSDFEQLK